MPVQRERDIQSSPDGSIAQCFGRFSDRQLTTNNAKSGNGLGQAGRDGEKLKGAWPTQTDQEVCK